MQNQNRLQIMELFTAPKSCLHVCLCMRSQHARTPKQVPEFCRKNAQISSDACKQQLYIIIIIYFTNDLSTRSDQLLLSLNYIAVMKCKDVSKRAISATEGLSVVPAHCQAFPPPLRTLCRNLTARLGILSPLLAT